MATENNNNNDHTSTVIIDGLTIRSSMEIDTIDVSSTPTLAPATASVTKLPTKLETFGVLMEIDTEDVPTTAPASAPVSVSEQAPETSSDQVKMIASAPEPEPERQPNEITRAMMDFGIDFDLAVEHEIEKFVAHNIVLYFDQDGKKITNPDALKLQRCDEPSREALPHCYLQTEPFTTESFLAKRDQLEKFASRLNSVQLIGHSFSLPWSMEMNALWSRFTNVKSISLENSSLTCFPTVLFRLPKLKSLILKGNPITTLDWTKEDVKDSKLEDILLSDTKIQKLQESIVWPETLDYLDFDRVETLTEIECSFPRSLNKLILRGTRITDAPKHIRCIQELMLSENPNLTVLHLESAQCLRKLDVNKCPNLSDIEFTGEDLPNRFEGVVACECNFNQIPPMFQKVIESIEVLGFVNNRITEIPTWLKDAKSLEVLGVANNQLTSFPEEIVPGLLKLKVLDLSNNPNLNALPVAAMCEHMKRLAKCDIKETAVPYDDGKVLEEHCQKRGGGFFQLLKKMHGDCEATGDGGDENPNGNGNGGGGESVECSIC